MKLITYYKNNQEQAAILWEENLYDLQDLDYRLPSRMEELLMKWDDNFSLLQTAEKKLRDSSLKLSGAPLKEKILAAPVPHPGSCRDGYAFRQHVETARRNRGASMIPEFDQFPVFYFTNHRSITGPGEIICLPDHFERLDYELEAAIVICREGRNIQAQHAHQHIGGLMILNDFSARQLQMEEMKLNLGPAKGKDFATATGPWLVTTDELQQYEVPCKKNHTGQSWNLVMQCCVNGELLSEGNLRDMDWTFAEIIERASYGVTLYPGDIIGSGTVGTGCLLELNGTARQNNPDAVAQWLKENDKIEMMITGLGTLCNTVRCEKTNYFILHRDKKDSDK